MMNNNHNFQFSPHRDVLEAPIPESDSSRKTLLVEIKNRAKSCVMASVWMDAKFLYEKALEIVNNNAKPSNSNEEEEPIIEKDVKEMAILHSNLSLVYSKMGQFDNAKDHAIDATEMDPSYVKGWWRLGQSQRFLQHYTASIESMNKALQIEPNNKALQKEIINIQQLKEKQGEEEKDVPTSRSTTKKSSTTNKKSSSSSVVRDDGDDDDENGVNFTKSEHVKGYKTVNGKKTSYFHNELSEKDKQLIGDIAPKKLDTNGNNTSTTTPMMQIETTTTPIIDTSTSAWNQAGTWEEKDATQWAKDELKKQLVDHCKYDIPLDLNPIWSSYVSFEGDLVCKIDKCNLIDGHASCATVRGKKRYIYEFKIELVWKIQTETNKDLLLAHGELTFPDIDGTMEIGKGYDIDNYKIRKNFEPNKITTKMINDVIINGGLRSKLNHAIDTFVIKFKETY